VVAGFQATKTGCSYYPFSGTTLAAVARFVRAYDQTKSALHFSPDKPLPLTLVRRLIEARMAEMKEGAQPRRPMSRRRKGDARHGQPVDSFQLQVHYVRQRQVEARAAVLRVEELEHRLPELGPAARPRPGRW
jgi:hypothetical protein